MNVFSAGMEDLSGAERRTVRRAISRAQQLDDRRLAAALVRHANHYFANPWHYELVFAGSVGLLVAVAVAVLSPLIGGLAATPLDWVFWGLAMAAAQLLIGRPLRQSQFSAARRRHVRGD